MLKPELKLTENTRKVVHILSGIVSALSLVALISFSPVGQNFLNNVNNTPQEQPVETQNVNPQKPHFLGKRYTFFLDTRTFTSTENGNVTILIAKDNDNVKMTITPLRGTSYTQLCTDTEQYASPLEEICELNVMTIYSAYQTQADGIVTTVYCVDDGVGSSIEIKYTVPENEINFTKDFELLLSMFKLL